jgi:hypothetical protein
MPFDEKEYRQENYRQNLEQQKRRYIVTSRPQSAPKKFVMLNGLAEVDIGIGPLARAHTGTPIKQNMYAHQRPFWDDPKVAGHFIVPDIIVTQMSVAQMSVAPLDNQDAKIDKNVRKLNYCGVVNNSATQTGPKQGSAAFSQTKLQKVGGGGFISSSCKRAPRPQSLQPTLPTMTSSEVTFISGVHFSAQQRIKLDRKTDELGKVETKK